MKYTWSMAKTIIMISFFKSLKKKKKKKKNLDLAICTELLAEEIRKEKPTQTSTNSIDSERNRPLDLTHTRVQIPKGGASHQKPYLGQLPDYFHLVVTLWPKERPFQFQPWQSADSSSLWSIVFRLIPFKHWSGNTRKEDQYPIAITISNSFCINSSFCLI